MDFKPRIAITTGDPAGVGPELCLQLLSQSDLASRYIPVVFGDLNVLQEVGRRLDINLPNVETDFSQLGFVMRPTIVDFQLVRQHDVTPGKVTAQTGLASYEYVKRAIQAALQGDVHAIVTGPLHKEALHEAGVPYPGHTEILVDHCEVDRHCMMLTSPEITCSLVTTHVGLDEVAALLSTEKILETIELSHDMMQKTRGLDPTIVVCGLNPHAGEGGLFGKREEQRLIEPAVHAAREKGMDVVGPLPPDTAFVPSRRASTDVFVCMYHDQGLIPLKALAFDTAVNVTLGLPIVRTSVDHGTALDIAWQGKADVSSFICATKLAIQMSSDR